MVASVSALTNSAQATSYYEADDYYSEGGLSPSEWQGAGAEVLGLSGEVERDQFRDLLDGRIGEQQLGTFRDGQLEHRPGWDVTLSAPKSVSIMAEVAGDRRLTAAHGEAVRTAMAHVEKHMTATRNAAGFFEDTLRYLYMPRLKSRDVLAQAIRTGAASEDFFGTAYGEADGKFEGFSLGGGDVVFDDTLLLIEPQAAKSYEEANRPEATPAPEAPVTPGRVAEAKGTFFPSDEAGPEDGPILAPVSPASAKPKAFFGSAEVPPATAKMRLVQIAEEIVSVLTSDPNAAVRLVVEISAEFPDGANESLKRAVSENARSLGLKSADWE